MHVLFRCMLSSERVGVQPGVIGTSWHPRAPRVFLLGRHTPAPPRLLDAPLHLLCVALAGAPAATSSRVSRPAGNDASGSGHLHRGGSLRLLQQGSRQLTRPHPADSRSATVGKRRRRYMAGARGRAEVLPACMCVISVGLVPGAFQQPVPKVRSSQSASLGQGSPAGLRVRGDEGSQRNGTEAESRSQLLARTRGAVPRCVVMKLSAARSPKGAFSKRARIQPCRACLRSTRNHVCTVAQYTESIWGTCTPSHFGSWVPLGYIGVLMDTAHLKRRTIHVKCPCSLQPGARRCGPSPAIQRTPSRRLHSSCPVVRLSAQLSFNSHPPPPCRSITPLQKKNVCVLQMTSRPGRKARRSITRHL